MMRPVNQQLNWRPIVELEAKAMSTERSRDRAKEQQTPVMEFAEIPGTGLRVSRISLGT